MDTIRLFVGLEPTREICDRALREAKAAIVGFPNQIRWEPDSNLHVTLKFLGDVAEDRVPEICRTLERVADGCRRFDYRTGGLGVFPEKGEPRVLWVAVQDVQSQLADLAGDLEAAFAELNFARERRTFTPHLTVARLDPSRPAESGEPAVRRMLARSVRVGESQQHADRFHLYQSRARQGGTNEYVKLATFNLGAIHS